MLVLKKKSQGFKICHTEAYTLCIIDLYVGKNSLLLDRKK